MRSRTRLAILSLFAAGAFSVGIFFILPEDALPLQQKELGEMATIALPPDPFDKITITGKAAYVYDISQKTVLYEKNATTTLPLASLTKVFASIAANEILPRTATVEIDRAALATDGESGLIESESWDAKELLAFTLVTSSNDAMKAVGRTVESEEHRDLVAEMNKKAQELGMNDSYFLNETGLDITKGISGAYGSASDVGRGIAYAYRKHYDIFKATQDPEGMFSSLNNGTHRGTNTNKIVDRIPSLILSKTGYTELAGGNLAVVFEREPNHPIAVVVLGSTEDERFTDVEKLIFAALRK